MLTINSHTSFNSGPKVLVGVRAIAAADSMMVDDNVKGFGKIRPSDSPGQVIGRISIPVRKPNLSLEFHDAFSVPYMVIFHVERTL
jgi:hypothetical protein